MRRVSLATSLYKAAMTGLGGRGARDPREGHLRLRRQRHRLEGAVRLHAPLRAGGGPRSARCSLISLWFVPRGAHGARTHTARPMKTNEIRQKFIDYFASKGHQPVRLEPARPRQRPDAALHQRRDGPVQGRLPRPGQAPVQPRGHRAALRARRRQAQRPRERGLHRAPPHVLRDARQLQLRRLLQARRDPFAWELLTVHYGLPKEKLWTTVYATDDEAYDIWTKEIGVPAERCVRLGDKPGGRKYESDNFWQMADTGPCGPCSEIFYDHGPEVAGGPARLPGRRRRPLHRDLEPRLHAVQPRRGGHDAPAAQALGGHRHGPRAPDRGAAARALELRDRPVPGAGQGRGARDAARRTSPRPACASSPTTSAPAPSWSAMASSPATRGAATCCAASRAAACATATSSGRRSRSSTSSCPTSCARWARPIPSSRASRRA